MRILHVLRAGQFGGLRTYTDGLLPALAEAGHESSIISADGDGAPTAREAVAQVAKADIAVVHSTMDQATAAAVLGSLPSVFFEHTYDATCASGARYLRLPGRACTLVGTPDPRCLIGAYVWGCNTRRPLRLADRYSTDRRHAQHMRASHAVIVDSKYASRVIAASGYEPLRIHVLPSPIADDLFAISPAPENGRVLFVGRVTPEKGLEKLVQAIATLPPHVRLVVAGDGGAVPAARDAAQVLGLSDRVEWLGRLDRPEMLEQYRRAAVVVVPSVWPEIWGMVGPEAMAAAVPVVAFAVGGIPEWLEDGVTGWLVEPDSVGALAEAIHLVLLDPLGAAEMGRVARRVAAESYRYPAHVNGFLTALGAALAHGRTTQ